METKLISQLHTINELSMVTDIPDEMKQFEPDRKIRVFGLKSMESDELICVAVFLNNNPGQDQIQLLTLYTEPVYRNQKFMELLLNEVRICLKTEGVNQIFAKLVGYDVDKLYIFGKLAERIGFQPLIIEGFLLVYNIKELELSKIKKIKKLPSGYLIKAITDLTISEKKELIDDEFIQKNIIKLKQRSGSESQLLFIKDTKTQKSIPVIYLDVVNDANNVPIFGFYERTINNDNTDILVPFMLYTLQKCVRENISQLEFRIVVIGNKRKDDIQKTLGTAKQVLRLQEYIMKI